MNNNLHDSQLLTGRSNLWSHPTVGCDIEKNNWLIRLESDKVAYAKVTMDNFVLSSAIDKLEFVMRQTYYTIGLPLKQILPHL